MGRLNEMISTGIIAAGIFTGLAGESPIQKALDAQEDSSFSSLQDDSANIYPNLTHGLSEESQLEANFADWQGEKDKAKERKDKMDSDSIAKDQVTISGPPDPDGKDPETKDGNKEISDELEASNEKLQDDKEETLKKPETTDNSQSEEQLQGDYGQNSNAPEAMDYNRSEGQPKDNNNHASDKSILGDNPQESQLQGDYGQTANDSDSSDDYTQEESEPQGDYGQDSSESGLGVGNSSEISA
jgi:hypothetical protein